MSQLQLLAVGARTLQPRSPGFLLVLHSLEFKGRIVQILLAAGADVRAKDKGGLIPLHNACSYGHLEVCEMLIAAGAGPEQVHSADLWQYTPLHEAASKARAEVCSLLLAH
ncbi:unnamed protein product, partial [Dibothriocephalus latus]